jgi:hypothetical protein
MFYIYERSSTYIMGKMDTRTGVVRPDHRKAYKTMSAAQAALTKMSKRYRADLLESVNDPLYRYGVAEAEYFHNTIEKSRTVYSIMDHQKENPITERVNMPYHCSPSSESFWSM